MSTDIQKRGPGLGAAFASLQGGWGDIFSSRLSGLALACLAVALAGTVGAAYAAFHFLLPMIPTGEGWIGHLWTAARFFAGAGVVLLGVALAPAISMIAGGALFDLAAARVENAIQAPAGRMVTPLAGLAAGLRIGLPALAMNLLALPLLFVPIVNVFVFFGLNGYLMGREYGTLAALRRMNFEEARALRARSPLSFLVIGLVCSFIPFVAPLLGAAAMTRFIARDGAAQGA